MNILYVANVRMPTEKAHGIQIVKMCEAFIKHGASVTLVVPNRKTVPETIREFYHIKNDIKLLRLPIIPVYHYGALGFIIGSVSFMVVSFLFILWQRIRGKIFVVYTVDMDTFSSSFLPFAGMPVFTEMHNGKPYSLSQRVFFYALRGVITINTFLANEFKEKFKRSHAQYLVEPNGVDKNLFYPRNKNEARQRLHISQEERIILYVGRFFEWKGLEIIPVASKYTQSFAQWYLVGGTTHDFMRVTGKSIPPSITCVGGVPQNEIVWWIAAADVLVVLGTERDRQSYYYTSPMKLFEYLLSERIVVASKTPAICEIVSEKEVVFYTPDSAESLAKKIQNIFESPTVFQKHIKAAVERGQRYSWDDRARRILGFIEEAVK